MKLFLGSTIMLIGFGVYVLFFIHAKDTASPTSLPDYKNISYSIDGSVVELTDGRSEVSSAPGSASKTITKYFGNDAHIDLNGDGREDVVFLLTQETGGSGVFYYAVAALNTPDGYKSSDGYFLGDRIAPQTIEASQSGSEKGVVVVNYADRGTDEPMSATPSVGKSVYLKLDASDMQWGVVAHNFEGESR